MRTTVNSLDAQQVNRNSNIPNENYLTEFYYGQNLELKK